MSKRIRPVLTSTAIGVAGILSFVDFATTSISPSNSVSAPSAAAGAPGAAGSPVVPAGSLFLQPTAARRTNEQRSVVVFMRRIIPGSDARVPVAVLSAGTRVRALGSVRRTRMPLAPRRDHARYRFVELDDEWRFARAPAEGVHRAEHGRNRE